MSDMKNQCLWVIYLPDGTADFAMPSPTSARSWAVQFEGGKEEKIITWETLYRRGFRCKQRHVGECVDGQENHC